MISQLSSAISESQSRVPSPSFFLSLVGLCSSRERAVTLTGHCYTCQLGVVGWVTYVFSVVCSAALMTCCFRWALSCIHQDTVPHTSHPLRYSCILPELQRSCTWAAHFSCVLLLWSQVSTGLLSPIFRVSHRRLGYFQMAIHSPLGIQKNWG